MIKVGILGYGNLGRGVEAAVTKAADMELKAVYTRRDPAALKIAAAGVPCILIPSPNVTNNHQEKNARVLEEAGGAVVILERDCTPEGMYRQITELLADESRREQMTAALHSLVKADSADRICDLVEELAKS